MKKSINNFVIPIGDTKIAASMNRANHNRGEAQIFVVPVADLEFLKDQVVEVQTGSDLHLPISMWGQGKRMFHQNTTINVGRIGSYAF